MKRHQLILALMLIALLYWISLPPKLDDNWQQAEVISIIDGDSLAVKLEDTPVQLRLIGIDAPEFGQAYFEAAKEYVQERLKPGQLVYFTQELPLRDRYDRYLVHGYTQPHVDFSHSLNAQLVAKGLARVWGNDSIYYSELLQLEQQARRQALGIHSLD